MTDEKPKGMSLGRRAAGFFLIGLMMIGGFVIGFLLVRGFGSSQQGAPVVAPGMMVHMVAALVAGVFLLAIGVLAYAVVLLTKCLTFDFRKPFWNRFKWKLYVANIVVKVLFLPGVGFLVSMVATPILCMMGVPSSLGLAIPFFGVVMVLHFFFVWLDVWTPLARTTVASRLAAMGVSQEDIQRGMYIGISDPEKSSFKKLTQVEEDVGMLWVEPDRLIYRGDSDGFEVRREQLIEVERATDAGSMAAYGGAVDVILRFQQEDGSQRRTRLHPEGCWTLGGMAKATDKLAGVLADWHQGGEGPGPAAVQ